VLEFPVFRIGAVDLEADLQAAGREVAARPDVVAGEEVDGRGGGGTISLTPSLRSE